VPFESGLFVYAGRSLPENALGQTKTPDPFIPEYMLKLMNRKIRSLLRRLRHYVVPSKSEFPPDFDEGAVRLWRYVKPFTMTTKERVFALRSSVEYIIKHDIPGDIVECGVWRGGSMMAVARTLLENGATDRKLYLFDTFEGMSEPTEVDRSHLGDAAGDLLRESKKKSASVWAYCPLDEVKRNMQDTGYDPEKLIFVKGKVEETLPAHAPDRISLLRLDTDWYESTYHELTHLYPRLSIGGVLIIDDYGFWAGAKRAVDEFICKHNLKLLLNRLDFTGRISVKLES
jgi:O-methyltransferase